MESFTREFYANLRVRTKVAMASASVVIYGRNQPPSTQDTMEYNPEVTLFMNSSAGLFERDDTKIVITFQPEGFARGLKRYPKEKIMVSKVRI